MDVLEVVDNFLGTPQPSGSSYRVRQPKTSVVYLAVKGKRVAGCLLAEPLKEADRVQKSFLGKDGGR